MRVLIVLFDGFTEYEYCIPLLALDHYAIPVEVVGLGAVELTGMMGLKAIVAKTLDDVNLQDYQALFLPGIDAGARDRAMQEGRLMEVIRAFDREQKLIAAVCGAPIFLGAAGVLTDRRFASDVAAHPMLLSGIRSTLPAVRDGHILTGQGSRIFHFTALLVEALLGAERAADYRQWAGVG